ncbi:MAG: hypothetical protein A2687_00785 [Candidatus Levybacteria bacterium RIFCSPHIGHO2_01_FULL_38_26]|nr:MAG: hypothetical protein A2687_00785 [Candidatus Levybacteria bacterium RIFCSPHIGHO2_01_FULL_38_26]
MAGELAPNRIDTLPDGSINIGNLSVGKSERRHRLPKRISGALTTAAVTMAAIACSGASAEDRDQLVNPDNSSPASYPSLSKEVSQDSKLVSAEQKTEEEWKTFRSVYNYDKLKYEIDAPQGWSSSPIAFQHPSISIDYLERNYEGNIYDYYKESAAIGVQQIPEWMSLEDFRDNNSSTSLIFIPDVEKPQYSKTEIDGRDAYEFQYSNEKRSSGTVYRFEITNIVFLDEKQGYFVQFQIETNNVEGQTFQRDLKMENTHEEFKKMRESFKLRP